MEKYKFKISVMESEGMVWYYKGKGGVGMRNQKIRLLLMLILVGIIGLSACAKEVPPTQEDMPACEKSYDWGITMSAKDVTNTGLTVVISQSGGAVTGELMTGSDYRVERFEKGQWNEVKTLPGMWGWNDLAYLVPMDGGRELEVDWEKLYGPLTEGYYRIVKEIEDFRGANNWDEDVYYAYFTIVKA